MRIKFNVAEYTIQTEYAYESDILQENKQFPVLTIGRDSYIEEAVAEFVPDKELLYNIQLGRYSSVAPDVTFIIDMNHDYKKVCQGRISGVPYHRPELTKRKGQIIIMNDCWIGEKATLLSGITVGNGAVVAANAVVSSDVPDYAIVAGNPAKVIGYRFDKGQIEALQLIRWWNWPQEKVKENAPLLYGDIDTFIEHHLAAAQQELSSIIPADTMPIEKQNSGEEKIFLYIPDFEQDYPTYPRVIESFIKSYSETNYELLLYVKEDEFLENKLSLLDAIFTQYEEKACYINLFIGNVTDERSLFCQADYYITNRNLDNVYHMDLAKLFEIPAISSVDLPVFTEKALQKMIPDRSSSSSEYNRWKAANKKLQTSTDMETDKTLRSITEVMKTISDNQNKLQQYSDNIAQFVSQLSINQVAMNRAVNNLKYELFADSAKPVYPIVEAGEKAIDLIIREGKSLCRFGDGEFAVIAGEHRQKFQRADERLGKRLVEVLQSDQPDILICIADIYGDLSKYNDDCRYNIRAYMTEKVRAEHYALLDMNRIYYDTFLTRPYASYLDNQTNAPQLRFDHLKQIWNGRDLLIIEGEKTRMGIGNDLFDNARSILRILGPAEHAFDRYDDILAEAKKQDKTRLVLIAMGAAATVLAYDLACAGFQALDIGHIDIEYEWMAAGKGTKVAVPHKYNNEVEGGDIVEDIPDPIYENQIIAKLY